MVRMNFSKKILVQLAPHDDVSHVAGTFFNFFFLTLAVSQQLDYSIT